MLLFLEANLCPEHPDEKKLCTHVSLIPVPGLSVFQTAGEPVAEPHSCMCWRQEEMQSGQLLWRVQTQPGAFIPLGWRKGASSGPRGTIYFALKEMVQELRGGLTVSWSFCL